MPNASTPAESSSQGSLETYLTEGIKFLLKSAAAKLKGGARRQFLAETVRELGAGGQAFAKREFRWNRGTIRKGMHELSTGVEYMDAFCPRGRKRSEKHLPNLLDAIRDIVDPNAQVDATLGTPDPYIKLTAHVLSSLPREVQPPRGTHGALEQYCNGMLLTDAETTIKIAQNMTCKFKHPVVTMVTRIYRNGVKLTKKAMAAHEKVINRKPGLQDWFVDISPSPIYSFQDNVFGVGWVESRVARDETQRPFCRVSYLNPAYLEAKIIFINTIVSDV